MAVSVRLRGVHQTMPPNSSRRGVWCLEVRRQPQDVHEMVRRRRGECRGKVLRSGGEDRRLGGDPGRTTTTQGQPVDAHRRLILEGEGAQEVLNVREIIVEVGEGIFWGVKRSRRRLSRACMLAHHTGWRLVASDRGEKKPS